MAKRRTSGFTLSPPDTIELEDVVPLGEPSPALSEEGLQVLRALDLAPPKPRDPDEIDLLLLERRATEAELLFDRAIARDPLVGEMQERFRTPESLELASNVADERRRAARAATPDALAKPQPRDPQPPPITGGRLCA